MRSARAVTRAVPDRAPAILRRRSLRIIDRPVLASAVVIGREVTGRRRGRERAHHEQSDLRRPLHRKIFCWGMIFSDLPSPALASSQTTDCTKGFAQAGNRFPLFGIMP